MSGGLLTTIKTFAKDITDGLRATEDNFSYLLSYLSLKQLKLTTVTDNVDNA